MKTSNRVWLGTIGGLVAIVLLASTSMSVFGSDNKSPCCNNGFFTHSLVGNDEIKQQVIPVTKFNQINISGNFIVTVNSAKQNKLTLITDENLFPGITADVQNDVLNINTKSGVSLRPSKTIKADILAKNVSAIKLSGENILQATDLNAPKLSIVISGSNNAEVSGDIKNFKATLSGNSKLHVVLKTAARVDLILSRQSDVTISGKVKNLTIESTGQAVVMAKNLLADNVTVKSIGETNITIHANKTLMLTTGGNSEIKYYGNPEVTKSSHGLLDLKKVG